MINTKERERLRELARRVLEISKRDEQAQNRKLWEAVNDLKMVRPVVHVRDLPLHLLEYEDELTPTIEDEFLRSLEMDMLLRIYEWEHLRCHRVIDDVIRCHCVIEDSGFGLKAHTGIQSDFIAASAEYNHAERFVPQILDMDDLEKIKMPVVSHNERETLRRFELMSDIFDGILTVRLHGKNYFRHVPWDDLLTWMGIAEGLELFASEPELMHAAIDRYITAAISQLKQYEQLGLLSSNNAFENVGNNGIGFTTALPAPTENGIGAKLKDMWGSNADQVLTAVSPAMSEQFALVYERRYADLFGLYSYGCCDRLDHKITQLKNNFTNLRKISVSPFADLRGAMEQIKGDYVVCFKPDSNRLAGSEPDMDYLRDEAIRACKLAREHGCNLVLNMKTIITLSGDPTRLWRWCEMAREIADSY
jgi:hypothetical protein